MGSTAGENQRAPRVFISYSHDSTEHCNRVLALATRLRADGLNAQLDQFENSPPQGWPLWCARQILDSNYVLIICTALYRDRFLGLEDFGKGRGVKWEAKVIQNILYYDEVQYLEQSVAVIENALSIFTLEAAPYQNSLARASLEKAKAALHEISSH
jgi:hypothetical protein